MDDTGAPSNPDTDLRSGFSRVVRSSRPGRDAAVRATRCNPWRGEDTTLFDFVPHMWYIHDMETTFDKFINNNPNEREKFDREYADFLLSEFVLEKMEQENITVRALAKKAGVSPTIIQKIRSKNAEKINYRTFSSVLNSLGYRISIEKI